MTDPSTNTADKCFLVHYDGTIVRSAAEGDIFVSEDEKIIFVNPSITFTELKQRVVDAIGKDGVSVKKLLYRLPTSRADGIIKFKKFKVTNDAETAIIFTLSNMFPQVTVFELMVELHDAIRISSRGSRQRPPSIGIVGSGGLGGSGDGSTPGSGSATPVSVPVQMRRLAHRQTAQDSPTVDVYHESPTVNASQHCNIEQFNVGEGDTYADDEDDLVDFDLNDNVEDEEELANIGLAGVDGEEEVEEEPGDLGCQAVQVTQTINQNQSRSRPGHYDGEENVDVVEEAEEGPSNLDGRTEFCVGQIFPDRDAMKCAVKQYSIRRFAQYKVHESSPSKFQAKCVRFGDECNWSIQVSYMRQRDCKTEGNC